MRSAITALAFDYGLKNIGLAYGQALTGIGRALPPLKARNGLPRWEQIEQRIKEWQPSILVVGLPLNMDGSESELSQQARKFGRRLEGRYQLEVAMMDERLSSFSAKQIAKDAGHKGDYKDKPIDSLAAQLILEDWFRQTL